MKNARRVNRRALVLTAQAELRAFWTGIEELSASGSSPSSRSTSS